MASPKLERERRKAAFGILMIRERIPGGAVIVDTLTRAEVLEVWNFATSQAELLLLGERCDDAPREE